MDESSSGYADAADIEGVGEAINYDELKGFELESLLVAKRLEELKHSGQLVFDKQTKQYRPLNGGIS